MRDYRRSVIPKQSHKQSSVIPSVIPKLGITDTDVIPKVSDLKQKLGVAGLKVDNNGRLDLVRSTRSALKCEGNSKPPRYNKRLHKPGDMVSYQGKEVAVQELDADGNVINKGW